MASTMCWVPRVCKSAGEPLTCPKRLTTTSVSAMVLATSAEFNTSPWMISSLSLVWLIFAGVRARALTLWPAAKASSKNSYPVCPEPPKSAILACLVIDLQLFLNLRKSLFQLFGTYRAAAQDDTLSLHRFHKNCRKTRYA